MPFIFLSCLCRILSQCSKMHHTPMDNAWHEYMGWCEVLQGAPPHRHYSSSLWAPCVFLCRCTQRGSFPFSSPARIWKSFTRKSFSSTPKPGPHHLFNFYSIMWLYILSFFQLFVLCQLLSMLDLLLGAPLSHCSQTIMGVPPHHWLH